MDNNQDLQQFAVLPTENKALPPAPKSNRFIAAFLDGIIYTAIGELTSRLINLVFGVSPVGLIVQTIWSLFVFTFLYYALSLYMTGQTLGKKLLKIKVVSNDPTKPVSLTKFVLREFIYKLIGFICLLMGYIRILTDPDGRAWHDNWAGTRVVSVKEE